METVERRRDEPRARAPRADRAETDWGSERPLRTPRRPRPRAQDRDLPAAPRTRRLPPQALASRPARPGWASRPAELRFDLGARCGPVFAAVRIRQRAACSALDLGDPRIFRVSVSRTV